LSADEKFDKLTKELIDKFLEKNPHFASFLGLHDPYDYQLPPGNTAHILQNSKMLEDYVKTMKDTVDFDSLNPSNRTDWDVLINAVEMDRFQVLEQRSHELNPDAFDSIGGIFFMMITRDYAPLAKRVDAIIARLDKLPQYLKEFRSRFDKSTPVKLWTEI
jgi:hypothetical protein